MEALKNQEGNLTPEEEEQIANEAYAEEEESKAKPDEEEPKKKPDEEEPKIEKPKEEEKPEDEKVKEPEKEKETPQEGEEEEEPETKKEGEEDPGEEEDPKPGDKSNVEEEAKALAIERNINLDEAKELIEKEAVIAEKYGNDPKKLARAYRENQSAYDKLKTKATSLQESQIMPLDKVPSQQEVLGYIKKGVLKDERGVVLTEELLIDTYRKEHSDIAEYMEDDTILKLVANDVIKDVSKDKTELVGKVKEAAKAKRDKCMSLLPEADKHLESQIKESLEDMSDVTVVSETFKFNDIVRWARGGKTNIEAMVKKAREEGIKIGKENPVIEGILPGENEGGKTPQPKVLNISDDELKRAREMFEGLGMSDKEMIKSYREDKLHEASLINKNKES